MHGATIKKKYNITFVPRSQKHAAVNFPFGFRNQPEDGYIFYPKHVADFLDKQTVMFRTNILYFQLFCIHEGNESSYRGADKSLARPGRKKL